MERYNNYHRHDHISNIFTPDTNAHFIDYVNRALELGEINVWTTNHGSGGDIFEAKQLADANGLNVKFGIEGYIVPNPLEKDPRNYHIILIPKTNVARKKLNLASSHANTDGYYYKPRLFLDDLLKIGKDEIYITTACVAGLLKDNDSYNENILSFANNMHTIDGGTHEQAFKNGVQRIFNNYARKYKLLKDNDSNLKGDDVREEHADDCDERNE